MGAVMLGRAMSQARATWAGLAFRRAETSSKALRMRRPRSFEHFLYAAAARALLEVGLAAVLAGQEAAGQRVVGDDADALFQNQRLQRALVVGAFIEVVVRLQGLVAGQLLGGADAERFGQARRVVVGGADGAHLALPDELVVGRQRFLQRRVLVVGVRLVEIDIVGLQTLQRVLDALQNIGPCAGPVRRPAFPCRPWWR